MLGRKELQEHSKMALQGGSKMGHERGLGSIRVPLLDRGNHFQVLSDGALRNRDGKPSL
jgi:hypothetical protein